MLRLKRVESASDWSLFLDLPWTIYRGDSNWVPPLRIAVRDMLDVSKNPFFKHAHMRPVIALRDGKCVGRIVGILDDDHNKFHDEKTAFFGFYESIDDQQVASELLDDIAAWAKGMGMSVLRGPLNLNTNYECGLLVEGFNDPPTVMSTYNPRYYEKLFSTWGLAKAKDLYAYILDSRKSKFSDVLFAKAEKIKSSGSITLRTLNMRKFDEDIERILEIYNDAWEQQWGFVPMSNDEFRHLAKDLKTIVDPELVLIAEIQGEPAGFAVALPDVNQALKKVRDGKLFPTGLVKLLWHTKGPMKKRTINRCRVFTLGIKKKYRELGLGPLFYTEYLKRGPQCGYPVGEASWVLEDNGPMNKALSYMCGERTKTYRIYDRPLV